MSQPTLEWIRTRDRVLQAILESVRALRLRGQVSGDVSTDYPSPLLAAANAAADELAQTVVKPHPGTVATKRLSADGWMVRVTCLVGEDARVEVVDPEGKVRFRGGPLPTMVTAFTIGMGELGLAVERRAAMVNVGHLENAVLWASRQHVRERSERSGAELAKLCAELERAYIDGDAPRSKPEGT